MEKSPLKSPLKVVTKNSNSRAGFKMGETRRTSISGHILDFFQNNQQDNKKNVAIIETFR